MSEQTSIRVLVAEDSDTQRKLLVTVLQDDPDIADIDQARDGREAVELAVKRRPDIIVMDVRMPRLDGLAATKQIMIEAPTPIVLVSSLDIEAVRTSIKALNVGALSVMRKPPTPSAPDFQREVGHFLSTIKALSRVSVVRHWRCDVASVRRVERALTGGEHAAAVVAIAASTGGPAALFRLLSSLPPSFEAPILVVQHIASGFAAGLAEWLDATTPVRVKLARDGERVARRTVYIAPDDRHLGLTDASTIGLDDGPPLGIFRPSATYLYESVQRAVGPHAVAVILTGMGDDGVRGLARVREAGGHVIAQDETSCMVFGMPGAAIAAGVVDRVVPLGDIPNQLVQLTAALGGSSRFS